MGRWLLGKGLGFLKGIGLGFGLGAAGIAAEVATDKGKGGILTKGVAHLGEKAVDTTSHIQGRNLLLDSMYGGRSTIASFAGALAAFCKLIGFEKGAAYFENFHRTEMSSIKDRVIEADSDTVYAADAAGVVKTAEAGANAALSQAASLDTGVITDGAKETLALSAAGVAAGSLASKTLTNGGFAGVFRNKWTLAASAAAGVVSSTILPEDVKTQVKDYASGLVSDALHKDNFTMKGAWDNATNIANSAAHGVTHGVGYAASFALANTVGLVTGHSTQEMHKDWVGWGIDKVYGATVGLPDLSGHWAHAVDNVASLAAPMGLAAKVAGNVAKFAGLTGRAEQAAQAGASISIPAGP